MLLLEIIVLLDPILLSEILLIKNNVRILDNCVLGKHGFGFFPKPNKNLRYPHMGIVIIEDNCEIGCGSTIDRGSMSNTIIGKNTYLITKFILLTM
jgi:UDP-3-O-[3-hydroxymyristoyl] glucosamine N-acyltransferase